MNSVLMQEISPSVKIFPDIYYELTIVRLAIRLDTTVIKLMKTLLNDESGATAIEYALIAALVALAVIPALNSMSAKLKNTFNEVASNLK